MTESVLCVVRIPHSPAVVDAMEAANPDVVDVIVAAAARHMTRHRRAVVADGVVEVDEYADQGAYDAFIDEAGAALERYDELLGGAAIESTVYRVLDEDDSWLEVNRSA